MSIGVAIVEDSRTIRESLQRMIGEAAGMRCDWVASSGEQALVEAARQRPDVILMDIHLPNMSGIECTSRLKQTLPESEIIMLTVYEDNDKIFKALQAGACGYLLKRTPPERLLQAIREVKQGGAPMTSEIARRLVETFQQPAGAETNNQAGVSLTQRECEVLNLISRGYANKEVADQLSLNVETIRHHLKNVYDKFHVHSRTEAVVKFLGMDPNANPIKSKPYELPKRGIPRRGGRV
jgi:DNA-binding NarL/FixJ family response regulator